MVNYKLLDVFISDVSGVVEYPADLPVNVSGQMCYSVQADMWASHLCHNHTAHGFICQKSPHGKPTLYINQTSYGDVKKNVTHVNCNDNLLYQACP